MLALAIAILCTTSFSLIIRHSQRAGQDQFSIMALNYLAGAGVALALANRVPLSPPTWHIGLTGGAFYVLTYVLFIQSMSLKGVAIANAITRLSVLIPVLGSILLFREQPHAIEAAGAVLAISAMPLLSLDRGFNGSRLTRQQVPLLLTLFVTNGMCLFVNKWFHATGLSAERPFFLAILFGSAGVVATVLWAWHSRQVTWREFVTGVPLGVINLGTSFMLIRALDTLPGTIVFPVTAALGLVLTSGYAAVAWREAPGRLGQAGLALALVAVVLINL